MARYDALFIGALLIQCLLLFLRLETWREAKVILVFHIIGTIMEIFKTQHGSWNYPEAGLIRIGNVPLFSGFMYASVGSYIARIIICPISALGCLPRSPFYSIGPMFTSLPSRPGAICRS
jgi:uncharacterized membrane protein YoaT (DUF817 family)